ncbi:unnamed protein product [Caenorhabditis auriculariae]|uniref:Thioredoxin domain-containing protein n=1 Tax=Caenorhabditis auriculariae TaxID=2777116 RepID=A0A8S1GXB9_9PELO|nr:unnamed protein product [Caenorhabditis auriculariae]
MRVPKLDEVRSVLTAYHLVNLLLSTLFFLLKVTPLCDFVFVWDEQDGSCGIESREREILLFLLIVIMWKGRKATNSLHYVNNVFLYSKIASFFLFFRADPLLGIFYFAVCLICLVVFPEPAFSGPENVTYFQGEQLYDQLVKDKKTTWVVQFFTTWSGECKHTTPVFAALSEKFSLPNLRFAKLDVGRYPKEGERFRVNSNPMSRQLPTICVYKDGKEISRRPLVNENHRAVPFVFSQDNCIQAFDLLNTYEECLRRKSKDYDRKQK